MDIESAPNQYQVAYDAAINPETREEFWRN
jgi:hypothetical protein